MKISNLGTFALGVMITAVSIGAVTYVNAAGDATIKVCANKTNGAMRYLSRGSCRSSEKALTWNQMGPQGLSGSDGAKGETGTAGTNGSTGAKGETGVNVQNLHVVDADGRDLGVAIGVGSSGSEASIFYEGGIWTVSNGSTPIHGALDPDSVYSDSSCSRRLWRNLDSSTPNVVPTARGSLAIGSNFLYYKGSGTPFIGSTLPVLYANWGSPIGGVWQCVASTNATYTLSFADYKSFYYTAVSQVSPPPYKAPFTLVSK